MAERNKRERNSDAGSVVARQAAVERRSRMMSRVAAAAVLMIALPRVLYFLVPGVPFLEWLGMSLPSAVCLVLIGGGLAGWGLPERNERARHIIRILGAVVLLAGAFSLWGHDASGNYASRRSLEFTVADHGSRMAATSAVNFILIGVAMMFYSHDRRAPLGQALVAMAGFIAWLTLVGYAYDVRAFHDLGQEPVRAVMAIPTALSFLLLLIAFFAAQPRSGATAILLGRTVTGRMTRRLIPVAFFAPTLLGWLRLIGEERAYYGTAVGVALFALLVTVIMTTVILASARQLHREEEWRRTLEEARGATERQLAEQARLLDLTFDAILVRDSLDRITYWNRGATELYGWTREEVLGRVAHEVLATQFPQSREEILAMLERDGRWSGEVVHARRDGSRVVVFTRWSLDRTSEGNPSSILETNNDITVSKQVEAELRESRGKLQLLDSLAEATRFMSDAREVMATVARRLGQHMRVSRCAYADVGPDGEHFSIQHDYTDGVPSTVGHYDLSLFGSRAALKMRTGRTLVISDIDHELAPEDGADMFNALGIKAIICCPLLKEGTSRAMMAVHQVRPRAWTRAEVSLVEAVVERSWAYIERARAEAALRDSERQLRLIADAMPALVAYIDRDLRYRFANAEYRAWFGGVGTQLTGKAVQEVLGERAGPQILPHLQRALRGEEVRFETEANYRAGPRWIDAHYIPHRNERGEVEGLFVLVLDITDRKRTEEQLERANDDLERLVQERTASLRDTIAQLETFSYSITHDMRGPLRAMVSFAQILRTEHAEQLSPEGREYLRRIVDASTRLDRLIQDVLQYSRMARETLPMEPINLQRLLNDIVHQYPDIALHGEHITLEAPCENAMVLANPAALTQVVSNLIGNALKFVPAGRTPKVLVRCEERGERVRLSVRDNGIGVPADQKDKIFGVFQRLHGAEYAGTGIGLSIVKKAVERMGGTVGVESQVGRGSEFWFELRRFRRPVSMTAS